MLKFNSLEDVKFFENSKIGKGVTASIFKIYHKDDRLKKPYAIKEMELINETET